jgi:lipopolysaccharide transport system ATP-binding protein
VGTGFHPELTGRENVFLNGPILGMKQAGIRRKFDEIVAFAEVSEFIDTPVKRYSSGMYVRLAFAVARCLNKMNEVGKAGRTVFFVSHSMSAIQRLCSGVQVLSGGHIEADTDVPASYSAHPSSIRPSIAAASASMEGDDILLSVEFQSPFPLNLPVLGFVLYDPPGNAVFGTNSRVERFETGLPAMRAGCICVIVPAHSLRANRYFIPLWPGDQYIDYCSIDKAIQIPVDGDGPRANLPPQEVGNFHIPARWRPAPATVLSDAASSQSPDAASGWKRAL